MKKNMDTTEKDMTLRWINAWKQAGPALKEIKRQDLRHYEYAQHLPVIDTMLQWAYEHRTTRLTSGLVEQQRCGL